MSAQLPLDLAPDPPRRRRASEPEAFHVRGQATPAEITQGEARARGQDAAVLDVLRSLPAGKRLTPSDVWLAFGGNARAPLLTSIRRALTNLTARGLLVHFPGDRRRGPHGAMESTWGLS